MKKLLYLFVPYVFSVYSIILVYSLNFNITSGWLFLFAILLMLLFSTIVFFLFKFICKDNEKSSILTSLVVILLYQRGWFVFFYKEWLFGLFIILILFSLLIKFDCKKLFKIALVIALILTLMSFFNIFKALFKTVYKKHLSPQKQELKRDSRTTPDKDIYIILLDSYPSNEVLKRDLNFDNYKFIYNLKNRGFYVDESIYSNYTKTIASIPSFMNLSYIEDLDFENSSQAISNSVIIKNAYKQGYKTYYINPFSSFCIKSDYIDKVIDISGHMFSSLHAMLLLFFRNTLYEDIYNFPVTMNDNYNNKDFWQVLESIDTDISPKFVFAHTLAPHFPYLKNKYGENLYDSKDTDDLIIDSQDMEYKINKKSCVQYIQYINNQTVYVVDKIIKESKGNAYIVILGDHGLRLHYFLWNEDKHFATLRKEKNSINSTFNTFLAFYNPDKNYQNYKDKECLINFFRQFSNDVFKTKYPLLKCEYHYLYQSTHEEDFSVIYKNIVNMKKSDFAY